MALSIRRDRSPAVLRKLAKAESNPRVARRLLAIASALSGMSRKEAAEAAGMDRQALRDWVIRYNAYGLDGLYGCWGGGRPSRLAPHEQAEPMRIVLSGPDPEADGICAFTREDLVRICEARFGKSFHPAALGRVLRRLGLPRQKARPGHPQKDAAEAEAFKKGPRRCSRKSVYSIKASASACSSRTRRASARRAGSAISGGSAGSARRGFAASASPSPPSSPPSSRARIVRSSSASCGSAPLGAFALAMPYADTAAMQAFLDGFSETIAEDGHAVMMLDQAGWHGSNSLAMPANITLVPLPAYSPELNPVERVWLYLKERFLSHRLLDDYEAIAGAACNAWNRLMAEAGRIKSLCSYPWILEVKP